MKTTTKNLTAIVTLTLTLLLTGCMSPNSEIAVFKKDKDGIKILSLEVKNGGIAVTKDKFKTIAETIQQQNLEIHLEKTQHEDYRHIEDSQRIQEKTKVAQIKQESSIIKKAIDKKVIQNPEELKAILEDYGF